MTDPDSYLCEIVQELPGEVIDTVVRLAAEKARPPKAPQNLVDDLDRAGVPRFAAMARPLLPRS